MSLLPMHNTQPPAGKEIRRRGDLIKNLKSQFATSRSGWGGRRKPALVFTDHKKGGRTEISKMTIQQGSKRKLMDGPVNCFLKSDPFSRAHAHAATE
jgi:hypothetical protein